MKLWGGRFEAGPSEVFEKFSRSLDLDRKLIFADVEGSKAFAKALSAVGILTEEECRSVLDAYDAIATEARNPSFFEDAEDEDVHTLVIRKLKEKVGPLAAKIHTGRSRNEQVSLDLRLYLRESVDRLLEKLAAFLSGLVALGRKYPDVIIPGYTHLRRAQPVLWAHYVLAYFEMFGRDFERLEEARARIDVMPLGSGALAGSGFSFDRESLARELGFAAITRNSMDAAGDRDFALDFLYACSMIMLHLSRLAEDWVVYSTDEFGWMVLEDRVTSGSSLMPQKKNPDSLELLRGKAGRVFGDLTSLFITLKGLPMTYNRDLQEDKQPVFDAFQETLASLEMAGAIAESVVVDKTKAYQSVEESWTVATDLAEELSRNGVPFHRAHELIGKLVLESTKTGKTPANWNAQSLAAFAPEFTAAIARLVTPSEGMKTRELPGGTGPATVARALEQAEERLDLFRVRLSKR